jgi:hypothetical protein
MPASSTTMVPIATFTLNAVVPWNFNAHGDTKNRCGAEWPHKRNCLYTTKDLYGVADSAFLAVYRKRLRRVLAPRGVTVIRLGGGGTLRFAHPTSPMASI